MTTPDSTTDLERRLRVLGAPLDRPGLAGGRASPDATVAAGDRASADEDAVVGGGAPASAGALASNGATADPLADLVDAVLVQADAEGLVDVAWTGTDSPIGPLTLAATPAGLVSIAFGGEDEVLDTLAAKVSPRVVHVPRRLDPVRRQLDEYFRGARRSFDVPLDRRLSHGYRREVLEALSRVPYGTTVSYKDLAERTGHPRASRAVGTAMATNPIPVVVPCHRVLRTGGALGGYGGGLEAKQWLLRHEGALLA